MLTKEEYREAKKRMCASFGGCRIECPLWGLTCSTVRVFTALEVVEEWAKAHKPKTNRDKFAEVFGVPITIAYEYGCDKTPGEAAKCISDGGGLCNDCVWWDAEYVEPKEGDND